MEESAKANVALFEMFPAMILVMLTLLMLQVQSFKKAALVFGIAPLGLIGAVTTLHLFNAPFGFVALLGVIALAGMDMRNSVILIDQIEQDMAHGKTEWEAVIESAVRRARPVVLTAATAILAMIPAYAQRFFGADGRRDHGRFVGGYLLDPDELTSPIRFALPSSPSSGAAPSDTRLRSRQRNSEGLRVGVCISRNSPRVVTR